MPARIRRAFAASPGKGNRNRAWPPGDQMLGRSARLAVSLTGPMLVRRSPVPSVTMKAVVACSLLKSLLNNMVGGPEGMLGKPGTTR